MFRRKTTNYCRNCGASNEPNALYCIHCGTLFPGDSNAATDWKNPYSSPSIVANRPFGAEENDPSAPNVPGFAQAIVVCFLKKRCAFSGRASRSVFWYFVLFTFLVQYAANLVCITATAAFGGGTILSAAQNVGLIVALSLKVLFLAPGLSVLVRRLRDRNQSGWFALLALLIPFVGSIILLLWCAAAGTPGPNRFGPAPWRR